MGYAFRCVQISLRLLRSVGVCERSLGVRHKCIGVPGLAFRNRLLCVGDSFGQMILLGHGDRRRQESSEAQTDSENKSSTIYFDVLPLAILPSVETGEHVK